MSNHACSCVRLRLTYKQPESKWEIQKPDLLFTFVNFVEFRASDIQRIRVILRKFVSPSGPWNLAS